jgi:hypothetical protein
VKRSEGFALGEAEAEAAANKRETEHGSWTSYTHSHKRCLFPNSQRRTTRIRLFFLLSPFFGGQNATRLVRVSGTSPPQLLSF